MLDNMTQRKTVSWDDLTFPENYYETSDALMRYEVLQDAMKNGDNGEANQIRLQMWEDRYGKYDGTKPEVDHYLKLWLDFRFAYEKRKSIFGFGNAKKSLQKDLNAMGFERTNDKGQMGEDILFAELRHMVRFYLSLCMSDKTYRSSFLGIMSMKDENVIDKITREVYEVACATPEFYGLTKEYEVFTNAAIDAFSTDFPEMSGTLHRYINGEV
ncbi:MAG: hypothetical protein PHC41_05540 [Lachnospiraceae bacterium]|nr:hypothetical protein [Lachnospiraceae bacterium]MDD3615673.1 hypothetical protein [Lachnospiraceae bacterium]